MSKLRNLSYKRLLVAMSMALVSNVGSAGTPGMLDRTDYPCVRGGSFIHISDVGTHKTQGDLKVGVGEKLINKVKQSAINTVPDWWARNQTVYVHGAGVLRHTDVDLVRNANHTGNVTVDVHNFGSKALVPEERLRIYGGGYILPERLYNGLSSHANVNGDVSVKLKKIYVDNSEVHGGGYVSVIDHGSHNVDNDVSISGQINIDIDDSQVQEVSGAGVIHGPHIVKNSEGNDEFYAGIKSKTKLKDIFDGNLVVQDGRATEAWHSTTNATVGSVELDVEDSVIGAFDRANNKTVTFEGTVIGGGKISGNGGIADVLQDVSIEMEHSKATMLICGGYITDYLGLAGDGVKASATVGNIDVEIEDSEINRLVAGGFTVLAKNRVEHSDASVRGNVKITVSGQSRIDNVYMAGFGPTADVKGTSTFRVIDSSVAIGHIDGQGQKRDGLFLNTSKRSELVFGDREHQYQGRFTTSFKDINSVRAEKGSIVEMDLNENTAGVSEGDAVWLDIDGEGKFVGDVNLQKKHNVRMTGNYEAGSVTLDHSQYEVKSGLLDAASLDISKGTLKIEGKGVLKTSSDQIFIKGLGEEGEVTDPEGLKYKENQLTLVKGSHLIIDDALYNKFYMTGAQYLASHADVSFSGKLVDISGDQIESLDINAMPQVEGDGSLILDKTSLTAKPTDGTVNVSKNIGGKSLDVGSADSVNITGRLTLVGDENANGELVNFVNSDEKKVLVQDGASIAFGTADDTARVGGKLSVELEVDHGDIEFKNGNFVLEDVAIKGESKITSTSHSKTTIEKLTLIDGTHATLTGALTVNNLGENATGVLQIGRVDAENMKGARGDLFINSEKLNGLTVFLDPTYIEGQEVKDASRLRYVSTTIDGNIVAGHNSYIVLGDDSDESFLELFRGNSPILTWGEQAGETLSAAFITKAIDVSEGSLTVDDIKKAPENYQKGKVCFGAGSILVADISSLNNGALITADDFVIDPTSKAVIVGLTKDKNGSSYRLTSDDQVGYWNTDSTLKSANDMWRLEFDGTNSFTAKLIDAKSVYGHTMQGLELADAGMWSDDQATFNWVDGILRDQTGRLDVSVMASRFDAAMNPTGALATFATAMDRSAEFRQIVRGQKTAEAGNVWAHIMGGKTTLEGAYTGPVDTKAETDSYGVAFGGEGLWQGITVGAGVMFGNGDTENDDVFAKDDFDYYGLTVYGQTNVKGFDVLADASVALMKSDLTVGGEAGVDTDTDTTVYTLGAQVRKTYDFGVNVTPFVGLDLYHVRTDGYSNGHGFNVEDTDATVLEMPIGATVAKTIQTAGGMTVAPEFSLAVVPTFGDQDIDSEVRYGAATSKYSFTLADDVKLRTKLGVQAEKANFVFGLNAGYEWGSEDRSAANVSANVKYLF